MDLVVGDGVRVLMRFRVRRGVRREVRRARLAGVGRLGGLREVEVLVVEVRLELVLLVDVEAETRGVVHERLHLHHSVYLVLLVRVRRRGFGLARVAARRDGCFRGFGPALGLAIPGEERREVRGLRADPDGGEEEQQEREHPRGRRAPLHRRAAATPRRASGLCEAWTHRVFKRNFWGNNGFARTTRNPNACIIFTTCSD